MTQMMENDTEVHFKEQFLVLYTLSQSFDPLSKHATLAQPMAYVWDGAITGRAANGEYF